MMSAQAHEPTPSPRGRTEPSIRSIRAALPESERAEFQAEIESLPLHLVGRALADWDVRARALESHSELVAAAERMERRRASGAPRRRTLTDAEVRAIYPKLWP